MSNAEEIAQLVESALDDYFQNLEGQNGQTVHDMVMSAVEKPLLSYILRRTEGNQTEAANILGINRNTLRKKLKFYNLA